MALKKKSLHLKVQHIAKDYGEKEVLRNVSFELSSGKVTVLMGANGSGKTTLFHILSGFLKPDSGTITLGEVSIMNKAPHEINEMGISRTFQDLRLIGELSVFENVMLAFKKQEGEKWWKAILPNKTVIKEQELNKDKAQEILKSCFIDEIGNSKAGEISYGQQKLLNLACCIANDAQVLLLDEPVAGVNPTYRDKLVEVIQEIKEQNRAILIIEHNTDFVEAVADEILFLNEGKVTKFANYAKMRNDLNVQEAYI